MDFFKISGFFSGIITKTGGQRQYNAAVRRDVRIIFKMPGEG